MTKLGIYAALALLFLVAERLFPRSNQPIVRKGFFTDLLYIPLHLSIRFVGPFVVGFAITDLGRSLLPAHLTDVLVGQGIWLQVPVLLLTVEVSFYVIHRAKHRIDWWWRLHETHHSPVEMDWLTNARFHPLEKVVDQLLYLLPLAFLGASAEALWVWAIVDAFGGMFVHSNLRVKLGPLSYFLNGPEMHIWHHATARQHRCNFGNNFSFMDWIFGTAYLPGDFATEVGTGDPRYPEGNLVGQILYAFRRRSDRDRLANGSG